MPRRNKHRDAVALLPTPKRAVKHNLVATHGPWALHDPFRCKCTWCR